MIDTEEQIAYYLDFYESDIRIFAQGLRKYIKKEYKPSFELVASSTRSLNIGYGYTRKAWDCFCAIIVYSKHINISLPSGVALPDPEGILHGKGTRIRHIKIRSMQDIKTTSIKKILDQARNNALELLENKPESGIKTKTFVKQISG